MNHINFCFLCIIFFKREICKIFSPWNIPPIQYLVLPGVTPVQVATSVVEWCHVPEMKCLEHTLQSTCSLTRQSFLFNLDSHRSCSLFDRSLVSSPWWLSIACNLKKLFAPLPRSDLLLHPIVLHKSPSYLCAGWV